MSTAAPMRVVNRLVAGLPRKDRVRLLGRCETVDLTFGAILCEPGSLYRHIYFPVTGFISTVSIVGKHEPLEISLIGAEGMLGATLVLDVPTSPLRAVVQGAGTARRMTVPQLQRELRESPSLVRMLKRYLYVLVAQLSKGTGCSNFHDVEARLARWLLMTHDRAHADHFRLTHEFLAAMLGVRRSGVTIAAGALQKRGLIGYARGQIRILDRKGLEARACECYGSGVRDYAQLFA